MIYSVVAIVGIIVVLILNYDVLFSKNYKARNKNAYHAYRLLLLSICIFFVLDMLWGFLDPLEDKTPVTIVTNIYFVGMAFVVFCWFRFVAKYLDEKNVVSKILIALAYVFLVTGLALVIVNFFIPILFSYNPERYVPTYGRYGYLTAQLAMYLLASIYALTIVIKNKGQKVLRHLTIAFVGFAMAIAILAQLARFDLPMYAVGCIVCITLIHLFIVTAEKNDYQRSIAASLSREKAQSKELSLAKELAYTDPLTNVRNKHAYVELEEEVDVLIRNKNIKEFALFLFDLNDLKLINDTYGHEMGDKYIIKSCKIIQSIFTGCELYRFGGDEFIIFLKDEMYKNRYRMLEQFNLEIEKNLGKNEPIIAVGFSDFVPSKDNTLRSVFARADERMYSRKKRLKEMNGDEVESKASTTTNSNSRLDMYEMFYQSDKLSLFDMLNNSNCDELIEVDLANDTYKQFYHIDGKYFIPNINGSSYRELIDFCEHYIVHPDDKGTYLALMKIDGFFERLKNAKIPGFDFAHFRYKLQDGTYRYVEQVILTGEQYGIPPGSFRLYLFDINNLMTRKLGKVSDEDSVISVGRDAVTSLLTGKEFFAKADEVIAQDKTKQWCLISIDIEHFKFFDEWFGREQGDFLLAKIGAILLENEKENGGVAGYFGQDDFTIVTIYDEKKINKLYERIKDVISSLGLTAGFMPAFGVSIIEKDMVLVDAFDRASIAADKAKGDIRNRICIYNSDMQFLAEQEYRILTDFIHGLQNDEITFYLQPQVLIETGQIVGAEALARWFRDDGKRVPPNEFIPILEKYGFVTDLDQYIWEKVCLWIRKWLDDGHETVPVSLNVSRIDIYNIDIADHFHKLCEKHNIPHNLIKIEITESAYAETTSLIDDLVKTLRDDGFVVLMDDFGSGYSSLNMLSNLRLDAIKLDAHFLHIEPTVGGHGVHILESVVNMAKVMALPIIVEGVENKQQCDFLADLGCQYVQGFYYYRPMPIERFEEIITQKGKLDHRGFVGKTNEQFRLREFLDETIYSDSMLNNILGAVAIYSWSGSHVDIVRFNQQFYESVGMTEFHERLTNIEQFVPESEKPLLFNALKEAYNNRLSGAVANLNFLRPDGTYSAFRIHFYYLDKKEGRERFYGSAVNVTELEDLRLIKTLVAENSHDNLILINKVNNKWNYHVLSHGFSDILGLNPTDFEKELNNGEFAKRVVPAKALKQLMLDATELANKHEDFEKELFVLDKDKQKVKFKLKFHCVSDLAKNTVYILRSELIKDE